VLAQHAIACDNPAAAKRYNRSMTLPAAPFFRVTSALVFLACAGLLGYAYWLQFREFLDPCPLCIFQRLAFVGIGVAALIGVLHNPRSFGRKVYAGLTTLAAALGVAVAGRHIWIQSLPPDQVPECGPGLEFMLQNMPLADALSKALAGSGECASVDWAFWGLSMPWWALFWYLALSALMIKAASQRI